MSALGFAPSDNRAGRTWRRLSSEPHRLMFFCGALQAVVAMLWWTFDLLGRYAGAYAPISWSVPPMWAHAWLLLYGFFPFFMFGFLMTAGPNWLGAGKMPTAAFVPSALAMAAGLLVFYAGLFADSAFVAAGAFLHLAGWLWGTSALLRMAATHWNANARYAVVMFFFLAVGMLGDGVFALSVAQGSYGHMAYALHGAVWFFLLPIFLGVSTRMVPFFSSRVLGETVNYRPAWARPALMAGAILHGVLQMHGAQSLLWIVDLPLAFVVLHLTLKWGLAKHGGGRLLAVLHISLAMLALSLLLSAVLSIAVAAGALERVGLAPLHLLVIGYFSAMVIGMVSRVSLGHSGRPLEADALTWNCYLGVVAAGILRAAAELTPSAAMATLMLAAAALWLLSFGAWALRYVPMYLSPRIDAR